MLLETRKIWSIRFRITNVTVCDTVDITSWEKLIQKICSVLFDPKSKLFYSNGNWMSINDGFIMSDNFNKIYEAKVEVLRFLGIYVFKLPANILKTLTKYDHSSILQRRRSMSSFDYTFFQTSQLSSRLSKTLLFALIWTVSRENLVHFSTKETTKVI